MSVKMFTLHLQGMSGVRGRESCHFANDAIGPLKSHKTVMVNAPWNRKIGVRDSIFDELYC